MIQILLCYYLLQLGIGSAIQARKDLAVTIYNDNYAMVKDTRDILFDPSLSFLYFEDVAATIQPQTVSFRAQNGKHRVTVMEQNFQNNLVDKGGILKKYLKKDISVYVQLAGGSVVKVTGKLLSHSPCIILQNQDGVQIYDDVRGIMLPQLPNGLLTVPTLVWKVDNPNATPFTSECQIAYKATGFSWKADYTLVLNEGETMMDFAGWVSLENNSGKKYQNARVKLIAGEVNTVSRRQCMKQRYFNDAVAESAKAMEVTEKTFGDYHMYTLRRKVDINESSTKQVEFIPLVKDAKIDKYYRVSISTGGYSEYGLKAQNMIKFSNSKENKLGLPLPKGTVRTFKQDSADSSLEFMGEDSIDHTPKNEDVKLKIGNAFDLVVKKVIKSRTSKDSGSWNADVHLEITNHRNTTAKVVIEVANSYGDNLELDWSEKEKLIKESVSKFNTTISVAPQEKRALKWRENYRIKF